MKRAALSRFVMMAAVKKIAFAILCATLLMLVAASAWAQGDQCSGALLVGSATGCGAVITVTGVDGNGNATFFTVTKPNTGNGNPYDGTEDTLVGIVNNSGHPLNSITLTSPDTTFGGIFNFDGDGPCASNPHDCFGGTGYEGPQNTFTIASPTSGTVVFSPSIPAPCDGCVNSTWFALEGTPDSLTNVTQTQQTPPGQTTTFDFGPFNFTSAVPITSTVPPENALSITAVTIPPGTKVDFLDGTEGTCAVYDNTGGNCRAFDLKCTKSGAACTNLAPYVAEFGTSWDTGATVNRPGFGSNGATCTLDGNGHLSGFTNVIDSFSQSRTDPTAHGPSGGKPPGGDCWIVATDVNYPSAKLSITKFAPRFVKTGTTLPYGIIVLNLGSGTATAVTLTDPVPAGTTFQSSAVCFTGTKGITCQSGTKSPCALTGSVVTCTLGNLLPFSLKTGATIGIQLNFKVAATPPAQISNTATVNDLNNFPTSPAVNSNTVKTTVCSAIRGGCED